MMLKTAFATEGTERTERYQGVTVIHFLNRLASGRFSLNDCFYSVLSAPAAAKWFF